MHVEPHRAARRFDDRRRGGPAVRRHLDGAADRANAGNRGQSAGQLAEEPAHLFVLRLLVHRPGWRRRRRIDGEHVVGVEAQVDAVQSVEAPDEQAGHHQQHEDERDLRHDQAQLDAAAPPTAGDAPPAVAKRLEHRQARRAKRRQDAHEHADRQRERQPERQHARIDLDLGRTRQLDRQLPHERRYGHVRDGAPCQPPGEGESEALAEGLPEQPPARRAKSLAESRVPSAVGGLDEQEIRDVRTGDQQDGAYRGQEQQQRAARPGGHDLQARQHAHGEVLVLRVLARERAREMVHRGPRRCHRHAGLQPADRLEEPRLATREGTAAVVEGQSTGPRCRPETRIPAA